jgi:hypothetical protein
MIGSPDKITRRAQVAPMSRKRVCACQSKALTILQYRAAICAFGVATLLKMIVLD